MIKTDRLRIAITGFYGAGNSGDEAMLHNLVFKIKQRVPDAVILVATDRIGDWQHDDVYYMSALDRAKLRETDIFIVGGGDLGFGFGWNLLPWAKRFKNKCIMMGSGINRTWRDPNFKTAITSMLGLFDKIYVRDEDSALFLNDLGVYNKYATDMSFDLCQVPYVFRKSEKHITLCIRETESKYESQMLDCAIRVIRKVTTDGFTTTILPLCEEDAIRCDKISSFFNDKVQLIHTPDPEQHKYIIANSNYLVSLGRLHSLIYATDTCTPMIGMSYPVVEEYSKINAWMKHIDLERFHLDFSPSIKQFTEKWTHMRAHVVAVKDILQKQRDRHIKLNNDQFDDVIGLVGE